MDKANKSKKIKVSSDTPKTPSKKVEATKNGIIGMMLLLVVTSIAFSSYTVWFGVDGVVSKAMLTPQILFAVCVLIKKFNK